MGQEFKAEINPSSHKLFSVMAFYHTKRTLTKTEGVSEAQRTMGGWPVFPQWVQEYGMSVSQDSEAWCTGGQADRLTGRAAWVLKPQETRLQPRSPTLFSPGLATLLTHLLAPFALGKGRQGWRGGEERAPHRIHWVPQRDSGEGVWELFRRRQPRPSGLLGSKGEIQEGDKFRKTLWFWLGPPNQGRILRRGKVTGRGRGRTTEFHFSWLAVGHTWTELDGVVEGKVPSTR